MKNVIPSALFAMLSFCQLLSAQQTTVGAATQLNNDSVMRLIKAGLSDDLIISTINTLPGTYDTSSDGLIALKAASASDRVISAVVVRSSAAPTQSTGTPQSAQNALLPTSSGQSVNLPARGSDGANPPRVFLQSASKGTNRNAARDQSMEMSKDLERDCPGLRVTINQQAADYVILLNHIEVGFARDNQVQVANRDGDLLTKTKEGGSIAGGMKKACALILEDWARK